MAQKLSQHKKTDQESLSAISRPSIPFPPTSYVRSFSIVSASCLSGFPFVKLSKHRHTHVLISDSDPMEGMYSRTRS